MSTRSQLLPNDPATVEAQTARDEWEARDVDLLTEPIESMLTYSRRLTTLILGDSRVDMDECQPILETKERIHDASNAMGSDTAATEDLRAALADVIKQETEYLRQLESRPLRSAATASISRGLGASRSLITTSAHGSAAAQVPTAPPPLPTYQEATAGRRVHGDGGASGDSGASHDELGRPQLSGSLLLPGDRFVVHFQVYQNTDGGDDAAADGRLQREDS